MITVLTSLAVVLAAQEAPQRFPAEAFYDTTSFSLAAPDGTWRPDVSAILVNSDETGVFNAYAMDPGTGERTPLTRSADDASFGVAFLPDGGRFLFTADRGGDELDHLYLGAIGGEFPPRDLTPGEGVKAAFVGFVEGGDAFIATTNERDPNYFDAYRYDTDSLERELVFENEEGLGGLIASRDGRWLAGVKELSSADNDVYLVDLAGTGGPTLLTEHEGDVSHALYDFTPESDAVIVGSDEGREFAAAYAYALDGGERTPMIEADWDVSYVSYSPSGRYRVSGVNADARTEVTILDRETGRELAMPEGLPEGDLQSVRFSPDEERLALIVNASDSPSDVFVVGLDEGGEVTRLTTALSDRIEPDVLVEAEVVRYDGQDGLPIPAIQYRPRAVSAEAPAPAVVLVHGGPGGQSRTGYSALIQHMVNHGYAVLAVNNRGSSGYGKTFYHMDDKRHGEADLADVVAARDYLAGLPWIDGEAIAVAGGSYGGYMTMAALAFEPGVFDAGIDIFGVTNWERTLQSIPPWWASFRDALYDEMGDPATDAERHRRISPLFHADRITEPVLIVQGANDPRVLQVESDEMVEALRRNDVPVEYLLFDDEGHGFLKKANRIEASDAYVRFLDRYLRGEGERQAGD